jgi:hypothetical protein
VPTSLLAGTAKLFGMIVVTARHIEGRRLRLACAHHAIGDTAHGEFVALAHYLLSN